jgi:hypothetical protein
MSLNYGRYILPADFDQWGLVDGDGVSVLGRFLQRHGVPDKFMERWRAEKPLCESEADWEVFKVELPEIYSRYNIVESFDASFDAASESML